jgi:hypothetical protein
MKLYIKSTQSIFAGTKYDKKAAQILVNSGLYNEAQAATIIDALFHQDIHAFVHAPSWTEKYLVGIARMCVEEGHGTAQGVSQFINDSVRVFDQFLTYVKEHRDTLGGTDFDTKFMKSMKYQEVVDMMDAIQAELDKQSDVALIDMETASVSNYKLVPINSYTQFHNLFGGHWTGDGSSDDYAGGGGTAWCYANAKGVYDSWVKRGKLFVLANKYFKRIKFNPKSNAKDPKDKYGNSLICICVNKSTGRLLNATLRCNHVGVSSMADNQYNTYAELSRVVGFNVKEAVRENLGLSNTLQSHNYSATFNVGDIINVDFDNGDFSATAIQKTPEGMMFVFDDSIGKSAMGERGEIMKNYLRKFKYSFPENLQNRLLELRLLEVSEVFADISGYDGWGWAEDYGARLGNPQIPYFLDSNNRSIDERWWLANALKRDFYSDHQSYFIVNDWGNIDGCESDTSHYVRPIFILKDLT